MYHQKNHKPICIDLLRQTNTIISWQVNFIRRLGEDNGVTIFFIAEKQQATILNFSLDLLKVTKWYTQWRFKKYWICWMKQAILKFRPENETLFIINQTQIIIYKIEVLKSNLCSYHVGYILVGHNNTNPEAFKNYSPLIKYIKKINGTTKDDTETAGSLWIYS